MSQHLNLAPSLVGPLTPINFFLPKDVIWTTHERTTNHSRNTYITRDQQLRVAVPAVARISETYINFQLHLQFFFLRESAETNCFL
jgi:hypothetical protein